MSSLILLSSSSFFLSDFLTKKLVSGRYSNAQFIFALKNNDIVALAIQEQRAVVGTPSWLSLNRALAKTHASAALKLAHWYVGNSHKAIDGTSSRLTSTKNQANNKTLTSPVLTKTSVKTVNQNAIVWFDQAIRLHSSQAMVELAQLYFQQGKVEQAQLIINKLPALVANTDIAEAALRLRLTITIYLGDINKVEQLVNTALLQQVKHHKKPPSKENFGIENSTLALLADIYKFSIIQKNSRSDSLLTQVTGYHNEKVKRHRPSLIANCAASLQLFATNLAHLKQLEQLIKDFNEQQPLADYICLPMPKYVSSKLLLCSVNKQQAILCDEAQWQTIVNQVDSRYIGLMLKEGGANVHLGMLYIDSEDDVDVFSHEVSHLLGFVDEYPLSKAHDKCQDIQVRPFSHNIAVVKKYYQGDKQKLRVKILKDIPWASSIEDTTPILQLTEGSSLKQNKWRLGTPPTHQNKVGVYLSESCDNTTNKIVSRESTAIFADKNTHYSAFKPLSRRTQLRYFAIDFPDEYLALLTAKPNAYLMPSFHYNIALALSQQGKTIEARYWLKQAAQWEKDPVKKAMVLNGHF